MTRSRAALVGLAAVILCGGPVALRAADGDKAWPYRTPVKTDPPAFHKAGWVRNPIDAFVLAKLQAARLSPSPEADRATLLRRVTFDLTGLPPTPEELRAFLADPRPDAYERVVERLLNSPPYGERWATLWLDLARYAETDGFKADDLRPSAWRYRDYVIRSFNADKPYDRFVKEQIAGDELYPDDPEALIATGFNRHFPDEYNAVNLEQRRQEVLNDLTDTAGQVFLGLTLGCARCHDHKFDPISQEDYYRFQAFFAAYLPAESVVGKPAEVEHYRQALREWEAKTAELRRQMAELEAPTRTKFAAQRKTRFPPEYQAMYDRPAEQRSPLEQQIAAMVAKQVQAGPDEVVKAMKPEVRQHWQELGKRMAEYARLKPDAPPTAMVLSEVGPAAPATFLLKRGDWRHPGKEVAPGFLSAIDDRAAVVPPPQPDARTTGRRRVLAEWLTRPGHPLTARVLVNRLWAQHFGRGIVGTPSDFGVQGDPPTHPELLDWLAVEFVEHGWSIKHMHRLMVLSATYRQASCLLSFRDRTNDPENRLLWRMNRRRLEGETLRDALLAVSGQLHRKAGGPGVCPELPPELGAVPSWRVSADVRDRGRRSVYVFAKRNLRYPLFSTFDAPDGNEHCARRQHTTTAPQALLLLNSKLALDAARAFAERVRREAGDDPDCLIQRAYLLAVGRGPDAEERALMRAFLAKRQAEAGMIDLCHALLNLNEFLYVD